MRNVVANRWYRWRLVFAAGCEVKLLAKDGVYLPTAPRDITGPADSHHVF